MSTKQLWEVSDLSITEPLERPDLEWQHFTLAVTPFRVVFGGCCNFGLIESGFIEREEGETLDETLQELIEDLAVFYNDGANYTSRIVCNERM